MLTVRLHGHLEEKFGSEFRFEAKTVREVLDALQANFDDFTEEFIKDQRAYNILVDAEAQEMNGCVVPIKTDSVIDIIPIVGGAGNIFKSIGLVIVGALLLSIGQGWALGALANVAGGTGFFAGVASGIISLSYVPGALAAISAIGAGLALTGVASLLAGPDGPDGGGPKGSTLSNAENIVGQGIPVPIGYGRLIIGSFVLSATYTSSYIMSNSSYTYNLNNVWSDRILSRGGQINETALLTPDEDGYVFVWPTPYQGQTSESFLAWQGYWEDYVQSSNPSYEIVPYNNPAIGQTVPVTRYSIQSTGTAPNDSALTNRN